MKLFVKRTCILLALFLGRVGTDVATLRSFTLLVYIGKTDTSVELCDLMGVLARSGYFNRARPIKVEMAKSESEVLDVDLGQLGLVHGHEEVGRQDASLSGVSRSQVEIELSTVVLASSSFVFDEGSVDDAT